MPEPARRVYWDADVLISWLEDNPERAPMIGLLLDDARAGELEIVTSVLATVEVAFTRSEKMTRTLDPDFEARIADLWAPGGPVKQVELYPLVAVRARNLIREGVSRGWTGLRANDAVHIATAEQLGVAEMHSYDAQLQRYSEILGFPICEPRSEQPRIV